MKYDGPEWREARNAMLYRILDHDDAVRFILLIMEMGEQWDDVVDGDMQATPDAICKLMWLAIVDLQLDPFYKQHHHSLLPVLIVGMNAWMDSIKLEQGTRQQRAIAYGLRDFYLEVIGMAIYLLHGYEAMRRDTAEIRAFLMDTHETMDDFLGEKT